MTSSPIERTAAAFVALFSRWRGERGLTKKRLAARMGFDPSYLSHVERGRHRPTADFARRAESVLRSGGAIWQAFVAYDEARTAVAGSRRDFVPAHWRPPGPGPVVEREEATLSYLDGRYHSVIKRALYNAGTEPLTRWLARIAVDRYPNDPVRSNTHHRAHPLVLSELELYGYRRLDGTRNGADAADEVAREPMVWRPKQDRDALKEVWLLFENDAGKFPLYPGERTTIEYGYVVDEQRWGPWFQRAVRLPTGRLLIRLDLPTGVDPQVWGMEISLSNGEAPLPTPINQQTAPGRTIFEWETEAPPVHARYRLQWRFRPEPAQG